MITEALEAQGYVVEQFRDDDRYLSVKWSTDDLTMTRAWEFMKTDYSAELEGFFTLLRENGWAHEARFVPIEHCAFIITRRDS